MSISSPPVFTDTVNQEFFIEAQGGAQNPVSYLDRFPDSVYNKSLDSILVKFLYALLGPTGVGGLRQEYLEARLAFEDAGLDTTNLDALYTSPFAFARLAEETYTIDAAASLLSSQERAQILAADASFRNRCIDFLKGVRAGGTKQGIQLVAKSGLNRPVSVIENYRHLYDSHSDIQLGLPFYGTTFDLGEVIILPAQDAPHNSVQTLTLTGVPSSGWFSLSYPSAPNYGLIQVTTIAGSNLVNYTAGISLSPGQYVSVTGNSETSLSITPTPTTYAVIDSVGASHIQMYLVHPPTSPLAGQPIGMPATGTFWAYVGIGQTVPLPYNAAATQVQAALEALPVIGTNVSVTGGPLPTPVDIQFINAMADQAVLTLEPNLAPDLPSGIGGPSALAPLVSQMTDVVNSPLTVGAQITVDIVGNSADEGATTIAPGDAHNMQVAIDQIRPLTSFVTTTAGQSSVRRQATSSIFTGDAYTEVLRYETGTTGIPWPVRDQLHWIEPSTEHEAPTPLNTPRQQYWNFHNVASIISYTEQALADPNYENAGGPFPSPTLYPRGNQDPSVTLEPGTTYPIDPLYPDATEVQQAPIWVRYWNNQIGPFSPEQITLYPSLGSYQNTTTQFLPPLALAPTPDPLVITTTINGVGIINNEYPVDYLNLPGVPPLPTQQTFWASLERTSGVDYLEVDLGTAQAVNYIYLEATTKPYQITVDYDVIDASPQRHFQPVTLSSLIPPITNLNYNATATNPWQVVTLLFTNSLEQMIFTRFIRIGFVRQAASFSNSPLMTSPTSIMPYSIEVRNLRVGRNVNNSSVPSNTTVNA